MLDLEFKLKPSKQYLMLMIAILLASLIIMISLSISIWLKITGVLLIVGYGVSVIWQFGLLRSQRSIISIRRHHNGRFQLTLREKSYDAELRGDSTVTGLASVLRFRISNQYWPNTCIIFRDSLEPDLYRQLLVILRMG